MALQLYKIASVEVGSAGASSMAFSSIPQGYTDLKLVFSARVSTGTAGTDQMLISFNGLTTNFSMRILYGSGTAAGSINNGGNERLIGWIDNSGNTAYTFSNGETYIPNYSGATNKSLSTDVVLENNATAVYTTMASNLWSSSAAITSLTLAPAAGSFEQYTTATLYGIL
jgi:hypothetical protein